MSKSKIFINKLAKLLEESLITSRDISDEVKNSLRFNKDKILSRLNLVSRDEFAIQKARLDKIQKEFNEIKKKIKKLRR